MKDIVMTDLSRRDRLVNRFVRRSLLKNEIHVSADEMQERMGALKGNQPPYFLDSSVLRAAEKDLSYRFQCKFRKEIFKGFPCYSFRPPELKSEKRVLYFCGGAFYGEASVFHLRWLDTLATEAGIAITMVCYPKTPTYTWAEAYEMAGEAYKAYADRYGAEKLVLMGDSSGGAIALTLPAYLQAQGLPGPDGVLVFSPACSLGKVHEKAREFQKRDPLLILDSVTIPVSHWCGDLSGEDSRINPLSMDFLSLPRTLMISGTEEVLYPSTMEFARKAIRAGAPLHFHVYKGMYHVFEIIYPLEAAAEATREAAEFLSAS